MIKQLLICGGLIAFGMGSASAQQQPASDFNVVTLGTGSPVPLPAALRTRHPRSSR